MRSLTGRYLFTSESVGEGHPDKVADQISDAILDAIICNDPKARVDAETLVMQGNVIVTGQITTSCYVSIPKIVRKTLKEIGLDNAKDGLDWQTCGILVSFEEQSPDIALGVNETEKHEQGAGDQGMMFGYATNETENFMPLALDISHKILEVLAELRRENNEITYLRPDAKSQVTIEYSDDNTPQRIEAIVVSTQHDEFDENDDRMLAKIKKDIIEILIPRVVLQLPKYVQELFTNDIKYHINPTGKFVIGGPHGDTGLTGRKIIVDTYGGKGAHGGGAFSGKDPSKVDRSAAYAARHIAKNLVAAGLCDEVLVQVSYAIGVVKPTSIFVDTYGTCPLNLTDGEIAEKVGELFDMRPAAIEKRLKLRNPIYLETAAYGHMGKSPQTISKVFESPYSGRVEKEVELFTWEKLDYVDVVKSAFGL